MFVTTTNENRGHKIEKKSKSHVWKGLEGRKGKEE